ncbi:helix-turn-helix transcriptional regulator [Aeromonas veronii]|uniref:helix-turn-helix domain-containing protein n=1 Tax=Aeromonas veronii TaxID=654 RepID=UPI00226D2B53|nr:helix-turn-helix transcriptional regulator [Aeromonas veronii]MCX9112648.1 helix-turn-helix transcriptional regulator [Aeromonas veronii]
MTSFRDRLGYMLKERGWKQADLVRKSGVSKAVISVLLSDPVKDLRVSSLLSIAKALGCDPLWLYTGKESGTYVTDTNLGKVPVWEMHELGNHPTDALSTLDSGRHIFSDSDGHLIGVIATDDNLAGSGIKSGDVCVIDLADREPRHNDIVLVRLSSNNQERLLKALDGLSGISLVTDDQRLGTVPIKDALVYGRMIELRRDVKE